MDDANYYDPVGMRQALLQAGLFLAVAAQMALYTFMRIARDFRDHW